MSSSYKASTILKMGCCAKFWSHISFLKNWLVTIIQTQVTWKRLWRAVVISCTWLLQSHAPTWGLNIESMTMETNMHTSSVIPRWKWTMTRPRQFVSHVGPTLWASRAEKRWSSSVNKGKYNLDCWKQDNGKYNMAKFLDREHVALLLSCYLIYIYTQLCIWQ